VGHALKGAGYRVLANDHNQYAYTLARCYVEADRDDVLHDAECLIAEFNRLPGQPGYFTESFCVKSRFFQPRNGARIDAIREAIAARQLPPLLESVLLVSLMEAADRVDSTTGVQMAYLKSWAPRAHNALELRMPDVVQRLTPARCAAHALEAAEAARTLDGDIAYLDPPYNQHSYRGNYHVWESLVRWDKPELYGVACKRIDCRTYQSPFNSKRRFKDALTDVIANVRARHLVVSFSNEGYITRDDMLALLATRGHVIAVTRDYKRYVGAKIGIYNPGGKKVGTVGHLHNKEHVFVCSPDALPAMDELSSVTAEPVVAAG
jgi:adenine-specific DNA-methyltransferase